MVGPNTLQTLWWSVPTDPEYCELNFSRVHLKICMRGPVHQENGTRAELDLVHKAKGRQNGSGYKR